MSNRDSPRHLGRSKITFLYQGMRGWAPAERGLRLTPATAAELRARGYSMVRVRTAWWHSREMSLYKYLAELPPIAEQGGAEGKRPYARGQE